MRLVSNWRQILCGSLSVRFAIAGFVLSAVGMGFVVHGSFQARELPALLLQIAGVVCMGVVPLARVIYQRELHR